MAFDYDGTLAPIVDDPSQAAPEPGVVPALGRLGHQVGLVAIITGRPAQLAVDLADLSGLAGDSWRVGESHGTGESQEATGSEGIGPTRLVVVGHYGMERWDALTGQLQTQSPPPGVDQVRRELPALLPALGLADAAVEDKGLSVAVHVRRMPDSARAFEIMRGPLTALAERAGLAAEPGRLVMELRPPGMDKGQAIRRLADETGATSIMFTGDDLGDLAAFAEVGRMRTEGRTGLLVCSGSAEVTQLAERADLVVDGPRGVLQLMTALSGALDASRRTGG